MNLINLREFEYEIDKIISFEDDELIFGNTEDENGIYKRYFYKYNPKNKNIQKINKIGIDTCESALYNSQIYHDYIYTNSYIMNHDRIETYIYRISLIDGEIEKLYFIEKELSVILLSQGYALLEGTNFCVDEEHSDSQKDTEGDYEYAILYDLKNKTEYEIKDLRVVWGIRDYFIPYTIDGDIYIVFEEAYMEDWELEQLYKEGVKKDDFYKNSYIESINIISLNNFAESVKKGCDTIPFYQVHKTELNAWTRYFGMDEEKIYYRVKDFISKVQDIYSIDKRTFKKCLIKSIQMDNIEATCSWYTVNYDIDNRRIYEINIEDDDNVKVKEIFNEDFMFKFKGSNEGVMGLIDNFFVTSFWTEDENGDNYKNFVKIRNINNGSENVYEGSCSIIKNNLILFQ